MRELKPILDKLGLTEAPCPVYATREHLHFWEAGAYFETEQTAWIEVQPTFFTKLLGYTPEEIITHEWIHALRKGFEDSFWEELIAYQVASRSYQRFLGPLFSQKLFGGVFFTSALMVWWLPGFLLGGLSFAIYGFFYIRQWKKLQRVKKLLNQQASDPAMAFKQLIRLQSSELEALAKKPASCIGDF